MRELITRIKRWWNGTPVPVRPAHAYAISGWKRGADGVYRQGDSTICRCGRMWVRDDGTEYPTLHSAIKQELPEPKVDTATLFQPTEGDLEQ